LSLELTGHKKHTTAISKTSMERLLQTRLSRSRAQGL